MTALPLPLTSLLARDSELAAIVALLRDPGVRLLTDGMSDREIATALFLSPRTVGWHVNHLLTKLDVPSRAAAAAMAIRRRLI